jgi:hypothetical protein
VIDGALVAKVLAGWVLATELFVLAWWSFARWIRED